MLRKLAWCLMIGLCCAAYQAAAQENVAPAPSGSASSVFGATDKPKLLTLPPKKPASKPAEPAPSPVPATPASKPAAPIFKPAAAPAVPTAPVTAPAAPVAAPEPSPAVAPVPAPPPKADIAPPSVTPAASVQPAPAPSASSPAAAIPVDPAETQGPPSLQTPELYGEGADPGTDDFLNEVGKRYDENFKGSLGEWKTSIMFSDKSQKRLSKMLYAVESGLFTIPKPKAAEAANDDDDYLSEITKQNEPFVFPSFFLSSIAYVDQNEWSLWINGLKITNLMQDDAAELQVVSISKKDARLRWKPRDIRKFGERWAQRQEREKLKDVKTTDGVVMDTMKGTIEFTLKPNQTFSSEWMNVLEGRYISTSTEAATK